MQRQSSRFVSLLVTATVLLTNCRAREEASLNSAAAKKDQVCSDWSPTGLPQSVMEKTIPFGKMPGVVVSVKMSSWWGYDAATTNELKQTFMNLFYERAKAAKPGQENLFYTVIAVDASAVGFFRDATLNTMTHREMSTAYTQVPPELKKRFYPDSEELEKYVLVVNDSDLEMHKRLNLFEFGGYVITRGLCRSEYYSLPADKNKIVEDLKAVL